jgi:hypothetical protein
MAGRRPFNPLSSDNDKDYNKDHYKDDDKNHL